MGNLVRLSDYMLTNALAQHAIDTSVSLLSSLQPDGSTRVGHLALMHRSMCEIMLMYYVSLQGLRLKLAHELTWS